MSMLHDILHRPMYKHHAKDVAVGTVLGVAAGAALGAIGHDYYKKNRRVIKRNAGRYLRSAENIVSNVTSMMR